MKAIIFDLWGTLLDNSKTYFIKDVAEAMGESLDFNTCKIIEKSIMKHDFKDDEKMIVSLADEFGKELTSEIKAHLLDLVNIRSQESFVFDDVVETLTDLKKKYMLIILSNTCRIDGVRAFEQIRHFFDDIILSYETGLIKPDMKAFQYVLDKHGLRPEDAVMVGDSIRTDFASRRVGIRAIIVDRFNKYGSDKTIKDLRLLKDMLR